MPIVAILVCYTGDLVEGQRVIAPLQTLGTPIRLSPTSSGPCPIRPSLPSPRKLPCADSSTMCVR
jgi:hypothetical protein